MIDFIFFTTNRTKVAHFRYLGSKVKLKIKSFQEANYYASYSEPRINDRADLLRQSYQSALKQWHRRQRNPNEHNSTFFFEDTSVCIKSLSKDQEIPGVNVKFWMREMTFAKLDALLKRENNDRSVVVRSDIIMHLPSQWRELLGTVDEFLWVYGEVSGKIVENEEIIKPNLVHTWLDDKSFNKWFVPDGADRPISALEIDIADKFDFRREAFDQIITVLQKLRVIQSRPVIATNQLELPRITIFPSIFIICGPTCSGKTTSADWINKKFGVQHIEASDFMYKAFWDRHGLRTAIKIGDFAEEALKTMPEIVASQIVSHINEKQLSSVVVTGFRSLSEIEIFRSEIKPEMKIEIIYLDAPSEMRFERAKKRNRDQVTREKFDSRNEQEIRMGVEKIREQNDVRYFENAGSKATLSNYFISKYREALRVQASYEKQVRKDVKKLRFDGNLESLILIALLDFLKSNTWLTTTEIASSVNVKFGVKKSKNNVSRYFNQEYHSYFEARLRETNNVKTNIVEYKLSATGISYARFLEKIHSELYTQRKAPMKLITNQMLLPL